MTTKETKDWLMRGWKLDREIDALMRMKQETWERITSVTVSCAGEPVQGTRDPHRYDSYAALEASIDERVNALVAVKCEIVEAVSQVQDSCYRTLLTERYTAFKTWEQIAVEMNYSWKQIHRIHGEALLAIKEVIAKMT